MDHVPEWISLEFQERILMKGINPNTPILSSLKYFNIVRSNILEHIDVRMRTYNAYLLSEQILTLYKLVRKINIGMIMMNDRFKEEKPDIIDPKAEWGNHKMVRKLEPDKLYLVPRIYRNFFIEVDKEKDYAYLRHSMLIRILSDRQYLHPKTKTLEDYRIAIIYADIENDSRQILNVIKNYKIDVPFVFDIRVLQACNKFKLTKEKHPELFENDLETSFNDIDYFKELSTGKGFIYRTPLDSFDNVQNFIDQMCIHPKIKYIFLTLYRFEDNSKIIESVYKAAKLGKRVFIYIEVMARGNEEPNEEYIRQLLELRKEYPNIVIRSKFFNYKIHGKIFLACTDKKAFAHVSTGNYNADTSGQYIDLHYISSDSAVIRTAYGIISDIISQRFTNSGYGNIKNNARTLIKLMIRHEMRKGSKGKIRIKVNHLMDKIIIKELQRAANCGVDVEVICRTSIGLNPIGIKVITINGPYLEHERIYMFGNNDDCSIYIGSTDLLIRNLDKRLETVMEISEPNAKCEMIELYESLKRNS